MKIRPIVLVGMILLAAMTRLVPHPPNFAPVAAIALFGAAHFHSLWAAFLVPITVMLLSDLALQVTTEMGLLSGWLAQGQGFYPGMWVIYGALVLVTAVGLLLRKKRGPLATGLTLTTCTLAGSIIFFLVTNFAWWVGYDLYPHTAAGLLACYVAAIPFFQWTFLGDVVYVAALFGGFALAQHFIPALRPASANAPELCREKAA